MAKYIAILHGKQAELMTKDLLQRHTAHLALLQQQGHLLLCGPLLGQNKVLQMFEAPSMAAAAALVQGDPYLQDGYYADYQLAEFIAATAENNYLADLVKF